MIRRLGARSVASAVLVVLIPSAAAAAPRFGAFIDPLPTYEGQSRCDPSPKPGVLAFQAMVLAREPGTGAGSISRPCDVGGQSEHKEGRAWDWGASALVPAQAAAARRAIDWLTAPDQFGNDAAMARRFGIMYLIYNRRIWFPGGGWRTYCVQKAKGCVAPGTKSDVRDPHTSHVHFSFTWAGALKQTSYWHPGDSMAAALAARPEGGYWIVGRRGGVIAGDAPYYGDAVGLDHPPVAIAATPSGDGYWMTTVAGHVVAFGSAPFKGQIKDGTRIADIAATPSGRGYWLLSRGGRVFPFGDAKRYGSTKDSPATAIALLPSASGLGYTIVTADGRAVPFGDAPASGALDGRAQEPFVAAAAAPLGGMWLATSSGEVDAIGAAPSLADLSHRSHGASVVDIAPSSGGRGYYLLTEDGRVRAFGDAR